MVFRSLADEKSFATVSYEALRAALLCASGSQKTALSTVSRTVLCLCLSTWLAVVGYRRDPRTGFAQGACYTVRTEPLSFVDACDADYLLLLECGLKHAHASVRRLARTILEQAMTHPDHLAHLPPALRKEVGRLHQQPPFFGGRGQG